MLQQELETGKLFGNLFEAFDDKNFLKSVQLFKNRFENNGFDLQYFKGKKCLDLGCGGGRYSIALSLLGAASVVGVDISETGILDAKKRAQHLNIENISFKAISGSYLPFKDAMFDCVICSGVLMHMSDPEQSIFEISRVLKRGGMVYLLVYATEGVRWPLINILRNLTSELGFEKLNAVLAKSELDVNKRRTYLDDLFVPVIDFYSELRLRTLLSAHGFNQIDRWKKGRLDHEESIEDYLVDLEKLKHLFQTGFETTNSQKILEKELYRSALEICEGVVQYVQNIKRLIDIKEIERERGEYLVIGQGHHRLTAIKK